MTTDLDSTRSAAVVLTRYGCAIYGTWTGKETIYDGWAPLPTRAAKAKS